MTVAAPLSHDKRITRRRENPMTTAPTSLEAPTLQALLERIEQTRPVLERNTAQTEADRRVPQENIEAIRRPGRSRSWCPAVTAATR